MASTIYPLSCYLRVPPNHSVLTVQVQNWELFVLAWYLPWTRCQDSVIQEAVRIIKFLPLHGLATSAIITYKPQKNSVKAPTLTTKPFLPRAQNASILLSLELCLQIGWRKRGLRSRPWLWCQRTGWVDLGWVLALVASAEPHYTVFEDLIASRIPRTALYALYKKF